MGFHAVECTSGNLTVPSSMVPVVPPYTVCESGDEFCGDSCMRSGSVCCSDGYCLSGSFCCNNGCAENGGECYEDGGRCPAGLECMTYQGAQLYCPDGDCTESMTVPQTRMDQAVQTTTTRTTTTNSSTSSPTTMSTSASCSGPSITYYNSTIHSIVVLQYDCSCPGVVSKAIGADSTTETSVGLTCTITLTLNATSPSTSTTGLLPSNHKL
jgi:hypothetical protein